MRILVIEDEKKLAALVKKKLEEERYSVDCAFDGQVGLQMALSNNYDAVVLDLMLPKRDGFQVLSSIRSQNHQLPVLITSARTTIEDKVTGLDLGADDYLPKPFSYEELSARMRSLLRRTAPDKAMKLHVGDLALDTQTHIAERWGREIELTSKEYSLLEYLMRNKNKIISRAMIATHVWKTELDADSNIIDVYVKRLRTKIERQGSPRLLFSVRGVGYRIKEPSGLSEDHDDLETTTRRRTYVAGQREVEPSRRIVLRRPSIRREVIDEEDDD